MQESFPDQNQCRHVGQSGLFQILKNMGQLAEIRKICHRMGWCS